jgi:IMP dehydrogenase
MKKHRIEKLPIIANSPDTDMNLTGLITLRDIQDNKRYPHSSTDSNGQLLVGAAIGIEDSCNNNIEKIISAGVDILCVDVAHAHNAECLKFISKIKNEYPNINIIAGNIATKSAAIDLCHAGVDAIKVGMGPGSICTTRKVTGVGVPQMTAISQCYEATCKKNIPIIADGGIKTIGDIVKALAAGANTVMMGSLFAGSSETPGEIKIENGARYKVYRGMGSREAMNAHGHDRYLPNSGKHTPEGVSTKVPYKGSVDGLIPEYIGGLKSAMGYTGCETISDLRSTEFIKITKSGFVESIDHINM